MDSIFESLKNLDVSEECFDDIVSMVEEFLNEFHDAQGNEVTNSKGEAEGEMRKRIGDKYKAILNSKRRYLEKELKHAPRKGKELGDAQDKAKAERNYLDKKFDDIWKERSQIQPGTEPDYENMAKFVDVSKKRQKATEKVQKAEDASREFMNSNRDTLKKLDNTAKKLSAVDSKYHPEGSIKSLKNYNKTLKRSWGLHW